MVYCYILNLTISVLGVRQMSGYEFSLRQEVLLEKGASVLGDLFRRQHGTEQERRRPLSVMYGLVWSAKQDILTAKTETELAQIEGQFNLADLFLAGIEAEPHAG